jgi:hypothetical protein
MTAQEIKSEIQKSLDNVPESVLQNFLDLLKLAENQPAEKIFLANNVMTILKEDKELLQRLAR